MRLIDAEKLEKDLCEVIHRKHYSERTILTLYMLLDIIRNRNTIKAEPAKRGKWITNKQTPCEPQRIFVCSECGGFIELPHYAWNCYYDYCPNCGAKMEGVMKSDKA